MSKKVQLFFRELSKKLQESTKAAKGKGKGKRKGQRKGGKGKRERRKRRKRRKGARGSRKQGQRRKLSQRKRAVKGTMKSKFASAHIAEKRKVNKSKKGNGGKRKKCQPGPKGRRKCTKGWKGAVQSAHIIVPQTICYCILNSDLWLWKMTIVKLSSPVNIFWFCIDYIV